MEKEIIYENLYDLDWSKLQRIKKWKLFGNFKMNNFG